MRFDGMSMPNPLRRPNDLFLNNLGVLQHRDSAAVGQFPFQGNGQPVVAFAAGPVAEAAACGQRRKRRDDSAALRDRRPELLESNAVLYVEAAHVHAGESGARKIAYGGAGRASTAQGLCRLHAWHSGRSGTPTDHSHRAAGRGGGSGLHDHHLCVAPSARLRTRCCGSAPAPRSRRPRSC